MSRKVWHDFQEVNICRRRNIRIYEFDLKSKLAYGGCEVICLGLWRAIAFGRGWCVMAGGYTVKFIESVLAAYQVRYVFVYNTALHIDEISIL